VTVVPSFLSHRQSRAVAKLQKVLIHSLISVRVGAAHFLSKKEQMISIAPDIELFSEIFKINWKLS